MSFKTMAQETLGELGASLATITYVFLGYTSMTAYASESRELLSHFIALPPSSLSIFFTAALASLIFLGGTRTADRVNQWLTALMLGLLVILEATAASSGDWIGLMATEDWGKVPRAVPVIIFSLVFHDIVPVICSYLECDGKRIRSSILIGSLIPLLFLLAWDGVVLSSSTQIDGIDPLELLFRGSNVAESTMAETFSILAVATSLIGTLLGFSSFFQEQFYSLLLRGNNNTDLQASTQEGDGSREDGGNRREQQPVVWEMSMADLSAFAVAVIPPLVIATYLADAFSLATDIASPYSVNVLLAGYDKDIGPSLYYVDYLATLHKVDKAAFGYGSFFSLSTMDRYYHSGMSLEEAIEVVDKCIKEIRTRLVIAPPNFLIKIVDQNGAREYAWRKSIRDTEAADADATA